MKNSQAIYDKATEFTTRLIGAVDTWTTMCLNTDFPSRSGFLKKNRANFKSTARDLGQLVSNASDSAISQSWSDDLQRDVDSFCNAFVMLAEFQNLDEAELEEHCRQISHRFERLQESMKQLAQSDLLSDFDRPTPSEREQYVRNILDRLTNQFLLARSGVTTT